MIVQKKLERPTEWIKWYNEINAKSDDVVTVVTAMTNNYINWI